MTTLRATYTARLSHALAIAPCAVPEPYYLHDLMRLTAQVEEAAIKVLDLRATPCPLCGEAMQGSMVISGGEARVREFCHSCRYAEGVGVLGERKEAPRKVKSMTWGT